METAQQVLAGDQIHAGLASHRRVHLGQQRGGDLDHRNAAHEDGGEKSGQVAHDAAAEGDDHAGPVAAGLDHLFGQRFHLRQAFARLASGEEKHVRFARRKRRLQRVSVQLPDVRGGDHEYLSAGLAAGLAGGI